MLDLQALHKPGGGGAEGVKRRGGGLAYLARRGQRLPSSRFLPQANMMPAPLEIWYGLAEPCDGGGERGMTRVTHHSGRGLSIRGTDEGLARPHRSKETKVVAR